MPFLFLIIISRNFLQIDEKNKLSMISPHTMWKFVRNFSLAHFFGKNFVKVTVLVNKYSYQSWFDEIFFGEREYLGFSTLCLSSINLLLAFFAKNMWNQSADYLVNYRESCYYEIIFKFLPFLYVWDLLEIHRNNIFEIDWLHAWTVFEVVEAEPHFELASALFRPHSRLRHLLRPVANGCQQPKIWNRRILI